MVNDDHTKEEAITQLKSLVKDGRTVHVLLRSVSSSRMSRRLSFFIVLKKTSEVQCLDYWVSRAVGLREAKDRYGYITNGLIVSGCGQDMGWACVKSIERALGYKKLSSQWL
jgi:hypothetical protein